MGAAKALKALHADWQIIEASNSDEAHARVKDSAPDYLLVDFNMPGTDGIALASEVRELAPRISVAVISANHQIEVINRAKAAGATFLPKPLTAKALRDFLDASSEQQKATP
jgi:DNA-binding NarL/FixJ family response regulator